MHTRISTRFATFLLLAILALSLLVGIATRGTGTAGAHTASPRSVAATAEDNDFPGSWVNHRVHLNPNHSTVGTFTLTVSGTGLPDNRALVLYSDISVRCASDGGLSGSSLTTSSIGTFTASFSVDCPHTGQYVVVAIDQSTNTVYNAILTLT